MVGMVGQEPAVEFRGAGAKTLGLQSGISAETVRAERKKFAGA